MNQLRIDRHGTGGTWLGPVLPRAPIRLGWFVYVVDGRPPYRWFPTFRMAKKHQLRVGFETTAEWEERTLREGAERRARGEDVSFSIDGVSMDDWVRLPTTDDPRPHRD